MLKRLIIDPAHGGIQPGAVYQSRLDKKLIFRESDLARQIALPLIDTLKYDGKVLVANSFEIAGKDISADTLLPIDRKSALMAYNQVNPINLIISIHLNASDSEHDSGLVVCHNNFTLPAQTIYDAMVATAGAQGFDIKGDRKENIQQRGSLAILKVEISKTLDVLGVSSVSKRVVSQFVETSLNSYKEGNTNGVYEAIQSALGPCWKSGLLSGEQVDAFSRIIAPLAGQYQRGTLLYAKAGESSFVPALLLEVGFITNAVDRAMIAKQPGLYSDGIKNGIYKILRVDAQPPALIA